jgi:hypothetical protein
MLSLKIGMRLLKRKSALMEDKLMEMLLTVNSLFDGKPHLTQKEQGQEE